MYSQKVSNKLYFLCGVASSLVIIFSFFLLHSFEPGALLSATIQSSPWTLPSSIISEIGDSDKIYDIKTMYTIIIENHGEREARHVQISIPHAKIFEVIDENKMKHLRIGSELLACPNLSPGNMLHINAWSTSLPITEHAENVLITTDGGRVRVKIEAAKGTLARFVDGSIIGVFTTCLATLIIVLILWHKKQKAIYSENDNPIASGGD